MAVSDTEKSDLPLKEVLDHLPLDSEPPQEQLSRRIKEEPNFARAYALVIDAKRELMEVDPKLWAQFKELLLRFRDEGMDTVSFMKEAVKRFRHYSRAMDAIQLSLPKGCSISSFEKVHPKMVWLTVYGERIKVDI